ncbi:ComEC/Rec2 family competence protein [uncultured Polaribacter sp.]|uniref:ComEC/Rec2 family competence protein n=1 Tax=uncultured Polaribacter sp. TaxID=174711 RepID=UPI002633FD2F|nr:ComEC/Rec2 family competence protein [uncultured Polaribacter sp.]
MLLLFLLWNRKGITFVSLLLFFVIGVSSVYINDARNFESYYKMVLKKDSNVILRITKTLKPSLYYQKYQAEVFQVDGMKTRGAILLNIQKDSIETPLKVDDKILVKPEFKEVTPPLNPNQFDYQFYLAKQGIYHQLFLENLYFLKLLNPSVSLVGISEKFRDKMQQSLVKYHFKNDEFAVISALLLGQRQDISKELITDYSRAGAIHILAVSGLHVGIILLILSFLFKPLERLKNGKYLKAFCIVLLLWMFAFIAGLSASVVRAVTMFTFLAIGQSFQRKSVVEFSLISSMLFLLIIKPMFLFDVGFQLSYLAVFGIIWIQPKLYAIYKPRFKLDDKIWQLFTVSIAAQVGILPLSIYYFQQFPSLFVVSNLVIIPFLGFILMGGILVIALSLLNILPAFLASIYGEVISWMNAFVSWISQQEQFLLQEISLSFLMMLAWYFFFFSGIFFLLKRKPKRLLYFLVAIVMIQSISFVENKTLAEKKELIVFHKSRFSIIGKRVGNKLLLQHHLDTIVSKEISAIKPYIIAEDIKTIRKIDFQNFINFQNQHILLVDSLGIYKVENLVKPIVVLQYSPKINLERLIKTIKPSTIIADGSNYKRDVATWKIIAKKQQIPFHYTGQSGAFTLKK